MDPSTWIYLIIWLLSYLGSRKAGLSDGKSALLATGITGAAVGLGASEKIQSLFGNKGAGTTTTVEADDVKSTSGKGWLSGVTGAITDVSKDFGSGVIKAGAAAGIVSTVTKSKYFPWLLGFGALFLLRGRSNA